MRNDTPSLRQIHYIPNGTVTREEYAVVFPSPQAVARRKKEKEGFPGAARVLPLFFPAPARYFSLEMRGKTIFPFHVLTDWFYYSQSPSKGQPDVCRLNFPLPRAEQLRPTFPQRESLCFPSFTDHSQQNFFFAPLSPFIGSARAKKFFKMQKVQNIRAFFC